MIPIAVMQSQLATEFSNCLHMPDDTFEQFSNRLNDICARMVNNPGEARKKKPVIKEIFATNLQILPRLRQDGIHTSWA